MNNKFARFCVVPDKRGLVLGKNFGLFTPGTLYQVNTILDEYVIRSLGKPAMQADARNGGYPNWLSTANAQVQSGQHLYTPAEWELLCAKGRGKA